MGVLLSSSAQDTKMMGSDIEAKTSIHFKYAQLLDTTVETIKNTALYQFIENWWKTNYQYGGATKEGIDCSSFSGILMSNVFGKQLPRSSQEQYLVTAHTDKEKLQEGDLVFFHTRRRKGVSHVGVYLMNGFFVHASTQEGVIISNLNETYYHKRFLSGGKLTL